MKDYPLYLESGPKRMKTMVHVFDLLGCIANGPTTEAALEATPEAIRSYLAFLSGVAGERVNPRERFTTHVAQHVTEGTWLGNGSPYARFERDLEPLSVAEVETYLARFMALRETIATWGAGQSAKVLDATPVEGRPARAILLHVLGPTGAYLSSVLGTQTGFSRLHTQAERGEVALDEALMRAASMAAEAIRAATPEQLAAVIERPKEVRTLRKALRSLLEHDWEHLRELSRRPGGPEW
jgi:predicted RNase H-like HicB family nuclease